MTELSLDISTIQPQASLDDTHTICPTDREKSLKKILDEFDKMEEFQGPVRKSTRTGTQLESPRKPQLLLVTSPLQSRRSVPTNILEDPALVDPAPRRSIKQEIKDLLKPRNPDSEPNKLTVGALRGADYNNRRHSFLPLSRPVEHVEQTEEIINNPTASMASVPYGDRRGSGGGLPLPMKEKPNLLLQHSRRQSSPNVFAVMAPGKLPQISKGVVVFYPIAPIAEPQFNFNVNVNNEKFSQQPPQETMSPNKQPEQPRSLHGTPRGHYYNPGYVSNRVGTDSPALYPKIDSPTMGPISNDYLLRVLLSKNNSNGGSSNDSPKSVISDKGDYKFAKVGSFSVFRKMMESEVKDN